MTTPKVITAQEFDSDAICNKLFDCTTTEIPWNYSPDGYVEFVKWLNCQLSIYRQQSFSAGRLQGLKEMDEANKRIWDEKSTDSIVAMEDLRSEYQKPN